MNNIIFSGCSYTYGEGLWRETGDTHQNSKNQKYLEENRWLTKVSKHFKLNPICKGYNGGNIVGSIKFVLDEIKNKNLNKDNTKLLIFQTTHFSRHELSIDTQITMLEDMVIELENKGILVRFIHWIWPDVNEDEIKLLNIENKLSSKIIRDRTIYILDNFNFDIMVNNNDAHINGTLSNKYTLAGKFKCGDFHMNQEGHNILAETIINYIETNKLL